MRWSDEQLRSYLDGTLGAEHIATLEADLMHDDALSSRLAALDPMASQIKSAFASVPVAERVAAWPSLPERRTPPARRFAAYAVAACLGAVATFGAVEALDQPEGWVEAVAAYQVLYAPETIAPLTADAAALDAQFQRASAALGVEIVATEIAAVAGDLELRRAQVLTLDGAPLVQIVFSGENGTPIALCLMRGSQPGDWDFAEVAGLESASRDTGDLRMLVIGPATAPDVRRWAQGFSTVL